MNTFLEKREIKNLLLLGFVLGICLSINDLLSQYHYLKLNLSSDSLFDFGLISLLINFGIGAIYVLILILPSMFLGKTGKLGIIIFQHIIALLILLISISLNKYFNITNLKLGSDLFGYDFKEIVMIVKSSLDFNFSNIYPFVITPLIYILIISYLYFQKSKSKIFIPNLIIGFISLAILEGTTSLVYFTKDAFSYLLNEEEVLPKEYIVKNEWPLLKPTDSIHDVLGENLNLKDKKPNIVFIVVEGLGRDFMGQNAQYKGFTPFLDSISQHSLYWSNFLSNSGRSFGALPSILGSAPFGKKGFSEIDELPNHLSLINIAKQNNYQSSYFEGGDSNFDNKIKYLTNEGIDHVLDMHNFGEKYSKSFDKVENTWGYPDSEIYRKTLSLIKDSDMPRLDILLTLSNHEPFDFPNKKNWRIKVSNVLSKNPDLEAKSSIIDNYKDIFASLLYTDNSIENFINEYKKKPEFNNTIFIITGDHRLVPVPQRNEISRFHVPLLIYSPMLKKPVEFKGVSSHLDIAPSIAIMLKKKYDFIIPKNIPWLGTGLSKSVEFSSSKSIPLMKYKGATKDFVDNQFYLSENRLFQLQDNFETRLVHNNKQKDLLLKNFKWYLALNNYVTSKDKIFPRNLAPNFSNLTKLSKAEKDEILDFTENIDFDKLYYRARDLAYQKNYKKALLLTHYITNNDPNHFDARTLKARIYGWKNDFKKAEKELLFVIDRSPNYEDSYYAILDLYWWSQDSNNAVLVSKIGYKAFEKNEKFKSEVLNKLKRFSSLNLDMVAMELNYEEELLGFKDFLAKN